MSGIDGPLRRERLHAQLLAGAPAETAVDVVERVLAVQAQDARGFRLAIRSRSRVPDATVIDAALGAGELVVGWLNRGTLHLVRRDDYWWLHALTAPRQVVANRRRLGEEGVSEAQATHGVAVVVDALAPGAALARATLRRRLDEAGVPTAGQALTHVLLATSILGRLVRGPVVDGEQRFVDPVAWIGPPPDSVDRDRLLGELARRYLRGHGPAEPVDLSAWSGLALRDAHRGFERIAAETEDRPAGCVALRGRPGRVRPPAARLLGPFDPLLHGWSSRDFVTGDHRQVVTVNGIFRPVALVDGHVVGTWRITDDALVVEVLEPVTGPALDELTVDGAAVLRFLGLRARPVLVEGRP